MREIMYLGFGALFVEIGVARGHLQCHDRLVLQHCGGSFCRGGSDEGAGLGAVAAPRLWRARFAGGMERTARASLDS